MTDPERSATAFNPHLLILIFYCSDLFRTVTFLLRAIFKTDPCQFAG